MDLFYYFITSTYLKQTIDLLIGSYQQDLLILHDFIKLPQYEIQQNARNRQRLYLCQRF